MIMGSDNTRRRLSSSSCFRKILPIAQFWKIRFYLIVHTYKNYSRTSRPQGLFNGFLNAQDKVAELHTKYYLENLIPRFLFPKKMTSFQTVMILYVTAQFGLTLYHVGLRGIHAMASSRAASSRRSLLYAVDLRNKHSTVYVSYDDILFRSMSDLNWILSADRQTDRQTDRPTAPTCYWAAWRPVSRCRGRTAPTRAPCCTGAPPTSPYSFGSTRCLPPSVAPPSGTKCWTLK